MPSLSATIVKNVEGSYIETYLKGKSLVRTDEEQGIAVNHWVDRLFQENKIDKDDFEEFLFNELFWGKRKNIRIYQLDNAKKMNAPKDWTGLLQEKYQINTLNFKNILGNVPNTDDRRKVAAITSETNYKGNLTKLQILFVCYAECNEDGKFKQTTSYYPVEIDFVKEIMTIKGWNRNGLLEGFKTEQMMNHISNLMSFSFNVKTRAFMTSHKKVLHNMSQGLILDIYEKIPAYTEIHKIEDSIQVFEQEVLKGLPLKNSQEENGNYSLPIGVLDFQDEIYKVVEKLCVSDYFYDLPYEEVWNMGVDTIISKIRFNDVEHILTSLSGETSEVPIFCTKTFMALKKSMEDAEVVERLWIMKDRKRGKLSLSYDATKEEYLGIKVLSNIRFKEEDLIAAEEIYNEYEKGITREVATENQRNVV